MTNDNSSRANRPSQSPQDSQPGENLGETIPHGDTSSKVPRLEKVPPTGNASEWIGRRLDRYELRALLGTGGMGVVYLAHDMIIERDVAIKMLPRELSADETALARRTDRRERSVRDELAV